MRKPLKPEQDITQWHPKFKWWPLDVDGQRVYLETVERRVSPFWCTDLGQEMIFAMMPWPVIPWEYRLPVKEGTPNNVVQIKRRA